MASVRSNRSYSSYRKVANGSSIDYSLFGNRSNIRAGVGDGGGNKSTTRGHLAPRRHEKSEETNGKGCVNESELAQIKAHSIGPFPSFSQAPTPPNPSLPKESPQVEVDSEISIGSRRNDQRKRMERAKARKEHMLALESNASDLFQAANRKKTEAKLAGIRQKAQEKIDREEDVVKRLETYSQRATAFHIRDRQLQDKAVQEEKEREYERRMELAMETDRLREIERREQEEIAKMEKLVEARKVIEDQINERHQQRLLQEEAKDQENRDMLEQIKQFQLEEEERARERREEAGRARLEVIRLNEEASENKRLQKLREKEEDEEILAYQAQQDEILRQREEEERQIELQKKEMQKKLLESQTRSLDRRAEMDELRARRAAEQKEREYRQKELAEAQKRKRDLAILQEAHRQQEEEKRMERERDATMRQEEYENALRQAADMARREEQEDALKCAKNSEFRAAIQKQIEENESLRKAQREEKYKEGRRREEERKEEIAKMEGIRDAMVEDLRSRGVNERYFSELFTLNVEEFLSK